MNTSSGYEYMNGKTDDKRRSEEITLPEIRRAKNIMKSEKFWSGSKGLLVEITQPYDFLLHFIFLSNIFHFDEQYFFFEILPDPISLPFYPGERERRRGLEK